VHVGGDFCILVQYYYLGPVYEEEQIDFVETDNKQLFYAKGFRSENAFNLWKK
jgi:hypothetical protein